MNSSTNSRPAILLFVRLVGCPYACLGRVAVNSLDLRKIPIKITWELLDYSTLDDAKFPARQQYFKTVLDAAAHVLTNGKT
jgi:hypothetical protein